MEDECDWHGKAPNDQQLSDALQEIDARLLKATAC
jgi:hypothetical protein